MIKTTPYDEAYATCHSTYASLRIIHPDLNPAEITELLGVTPTETFRAGDPKPPVADRYWAHGGWFLSSRDAVVSRDLRHHLDWLLERIGGKREVFARLQERKAEYCADIFCYWLTGSGHGGPVISPSQMLQLSELNLELCIDFYAIG